MFTLNCLQGPPELRESYGFRLTDVNRIEAAVVPALCEDGGPFMAITERELEQAEARMAETRSAGHPVSARFDRRRSRVVVALNTGIELTFPTRLAEGLADAPPDSLPEIEISPAGLGLHWPKLDADHGRKGGRPRKLLTA